MAVPGQNILLSVLIASLAHREDRLLRLLGMLLPQAEDSPYEVEVVVLQNNGSEPIAEYRNRLLKAARGKYLCFVDDDDMVPPYYVERLTGALQQDPDCVGFRMLVTGCNAMVSELSLRHVEPPWNPVMHHGQLTYLREFNQAMPVLSELAKQVDFHGALPLNTGEDMAYVTKLLPILRQRGRREVFLDDILYHYMWNINDTTQKGPQSWSYKAKYNGHKKPPVYSKCFRWIE